MKTTIFLTALLLICSTSSFSQRYLRHYNKGNEYLDTRNYQEAIDEFTKAIESFGDFYEAYYNRGLAKNIIKDYPGALNDYNKAIELRPSFAPVFNNRGLVKKELEDMRGAINDYCTAIRIDNTFADAYFNLANAYILIQQTDSACMHYRKAHEMGQKRAFEQFAKHCDKSK